MADPSITVSQVQGVLDHLWAERRPLYEKLLRLDGGIEALRGLIAAQEAPSPSPSSEPTPAPRAQPSTGPASASTPQAAPPVDLRAPLRAISDAVASGYPGWSPPPLVDPAVAAERAALLSETIRRGYATQTGVGTQEHAYHLTDAGTQYLAEDAG